MNELSPAQPPNKQTEPHYRTTALPHSLFLPFAPGILSYHITWWVQSERTSIPPSPVSKPTASDFGSAAGSFPVDKASLLRRQLCRRLTLHPRIEDGFLEKLPKRPERVPHPELHR
jgi:hypothetical protein